MAPVVLPAFLVAFAVLLGNADRLRWFGLAAAVGVSVLLAIQPDASQALALLAGIALTVAMARTRYVASGLTLDLIAMATAWAFSRPDPLEPVPHVEGVFLLAWAHSFLSGALVIGSAVLLLAGLCVRATRTSVAVFRRQLLRRPRSRHTARTDPGAPNASKYPPAKPGALECEPLKAA
jgi:hypothetical protein